VKTHVDERLREEAIRFVFRFACEDCAHAEKTPVTPPRGDETRLRCSLGYPAAPRREAMHQATFELCKEFELGAD
jgi:hypothetical protein